MARFTAINGKPLNENRMEEFDEFFTQHIFFKFMDSGRHGLESGVRDLVDTSIARSIEALSGANSNSIRIQKLREPEMFTRMYEYNMPRIMSAFITGGTKEMSKAIFACATDPMMFQ